jgi:hypothetical protein
MNKVTKTYTILCIITSLVISKRGVKNRLFTLKKSLTNKLLSRGQPSKSLENIKGNKTPSFRSLNLPRLDLSNIGYKRPVWVPKPNTFFYHATRKRRAKRPDIPKVYGTKGQVLSLALPQSIPDESNYLKQSKKGRPKRYTIPTTHRMAYINKDSNKDNTVRKRMPMKPNIANMFLKKLGLSKRIDDTVEKINKPIKRLYADIPLKKEKRKPIQPKFIKHKPTEENNYRKEYHFNYKKDYPFNYNIDNYGHLATVKRYKGFTDDYGTLLGKNLKYWRNPIKSLLDRNLRGNPFGDLNISFKKYNPLLDEVAIDDTVHDDFKHYRRCNYISFRTEIHVLEMELTWLADKIIITGHSDEIKYLNNFLYRYIQHINDEGNYLKKSDIHITKDSNNIFNFTYHTEIQKGGYISHLIRYINQFVTFRHMTLDKLGNVRIKLLYRDELTLRNHAERTMMEQPFFFTSSEWVLRRFDFEIERSLTSIKHGLLPQELLIKAKVFDMLTEKERREINEVELTRRRDEENAESQRRRDEQNAESRRIEEESRNLRYTRMLEERHQQLLEDISYINNLVKLYQREFDKYLAIRVNNYDAIIPGKNPYLRFRLFSKHEIRRFRKKEIELYYKHLAEEVLIPRLLIKQEKERLIELRKAAMIEQKKLTVLRNEAIRIAKIDATQNRRKLKEDERTIVFAEPDKDKRVQLFERWSWTWETSFKKDQLRKHVMRTDARIKEINKQRNKLTTKSNEL